MISDFILRSLAGSGALHSCAGSIKRRGESAIKKRNSRSDKIVIFDGICHLCNGAVQFIIKRDSCSNFKFVPRQSQTGRRLLSRYQASLKDTETIVLLKDQIIYTGSDAVLEIARGLDHIWKLLIVFKIIPGFIRNWVYNFIAKHRYYWFGKRDVCYTPTPELRQRFLE
jgi:predicted DCC family thiol-disulfide oxidoreductase YuxK